MENRKTTKSSKSSKSESGSNCFIDFFKNILNDKKKLIILISIIVVVIILIIVIAVVVSKKKNKDTCGVSKEVYDIAKKELDEHNKYRKQHHVGDLTINCDLMKIAQKYSEKLQKEKNFNILMIHIMEIQWEKIYIGLHYMNILLLKQQIIGIMK